MSRPRASAAATAQLAGRSLDGLAYGAAWEALMVSTLGFGAHGEPAAIAAALNRYLARGGNFLDAQDQPAALGAALAAVRAADPARRAEWVICAESSADPAETAALVAAGLAAPESGVSGYCFAPAAVRQQVRRALGQLGLETVDLFWLAGADVLWETAGPEAARQQLREALAALEVAAVQGELAAYGLSLRRLSLPPAAALEIAADVMGPRHHLRALRLPLAEAAPSSAWPAALSRIVVAGQRPAEWPEAAALVLPASAWLPAHFPA